MMRRRYRCWQPASPCISPSTAPAARTRTAATATGGETAPTGGSPNRSLAHSALGIGRGLRHIRRRNNPVERDTAPPEHQHADRQHRRPRPRLALPAEEQGTETNHYPGPIPVADVQRRLFCWVAESRRNAVEVSSIDTMTHLTTDGTPARWAVVDDKQASCRSDDHTGAVMGRGAFTTLVVQLPRPGKTIGLHASAEIPSAWVRLPGRSATQVCASLPRSTAWWNRRPQKC
jgi:hypothetical protein